MIICCGAIKGSNKIKQVLFDMGINIRFSQGLVILMFFVKFTNDHMLWCQKMFKLNEVLFDLGLNVSFSHMSQHGLYLNLSF